MTVEITFTIPSDAGSAEEQRVGSLMSRLGAALLIQGEAVSLRAADVSETETPARRTRAPRSSGKPDPVEQYVEAGGKMPEVREMLPHDGGPLTPHPDTVPAHKESAAAVTVSEPAAEKPAEPVVEKPAAEAEVLSDEAMDELRAKVRDLAQQPSVGALKLRPHFQAFNVSKVKDLPAAGLRAAIADFEAVLAAEALT